MKSEYVQSIRGDDNTYNKQVLLNINFKQLIMSRVGASKTKFIQAVYSTGPYKIDEICGCIAVALRLHCGCVAVPVN